jgi:phage RecT family recombinase
MTTDLVQRTQQVVRQINDPGFTEQLEALLPDNVPIRRFVGMAATAVRQNPDLLNTDQSTLFGALVRCAQDGLYPDGTDAALVPYKGKVSYIPMIGGYRKIAAEYGWTLRTKVVYSNEEFSYTEEPPTITHRPRPIGEQRGRIVAAYAIATHRDGRRLQTVLLEDDIAERRSQAQTQKVWEAWPGPMAEKSAGRDLFPQLPLAESDRRVASLIADGVDDPVEAAVLMYGPGARETVTPGKGPADVDGAATAASGAEQAPLHNVDGQQGEGAPCGEAGAPSSPGDGWDGIDADAVETPDWQAAGDTVIPGGTYEGKTLGQMSESEDGRRWLKRALGNATDPIFRRSLESFVEGGLPEMWAEYQARRQAA